jgi:hypothetical protein
VWWRVNDGERGKTILTTLEAEGMFGGAASSAEARCHCHV